MNDWKDRYRFHLLISVNVVLSVFIVLFWMWPGGDFAVGKVLPVEDTAIAVIPYVPPTIQNWQKNPGNPKGSTQPDYPRTDDDEIRILDRLPNYSPRFAGLSVRSGNFHELIPSLPVSDTTVFDISQVDVEPVLVRYDPPPYPAEALQYRITGEVVVEILIERSGLVSQAWIKSGHPFLNSRAIEAAYRCAFVPAIKGHFPVRVKMEMPVVFVLK